MSSVPPAAAPIPRKDRDAQLENLQAASAMLDTRATLQTDKVYLTKKLQSAIYIGANGLNCGDPLKDHMHQSEIEELVLCVRDMLRDGVI